MNAAILVRHLCFTYRHLIQDGQPHKIQITKPGLRLPAEADIADQCDCQLAFWTNRVPEHEPWSRAVMKDFEKNLSHDTLQFPYNSQAINKEDGDENLGRGRFWRR